MRVRTFFKDILIIKSHFILLKTIFFIYVLKYKIYFQHLQPTQPSLLLFLIALSKVIALPTIVIAIVVALLAFRGNSKKIFAIAFKTVK